MVIITVLNDILYKTVIITSKDYSLVGTLSIYDSGQYAVIITNGSGFFNFTHDQVKEVHNNHICLKDYCSHIKGK